ncbi:hypothetical protein ACQ4PT_054066 [Festuca glaucescens]
MARSGVEVIASRGCSRLLLPGMQPSSASAASSSSVSASVSRAAAARRPTGGPFAGLVVCVTGLSKVRLDESLYSIRNIGENGRPLGEFNRLVGAPVSENSCLPPMVFQDKACSDTTQKHRLQAHREEPEHDVFVFTNHTIYIDPGLSGEMKKKISDAATKEGAKLLDHWFIGCHATYVVCEDISVKRYVGHSDNIVTPLWILKTVKEKNLQRLVHLSSDLARQVAVVLENFHTSQEIHVEHEI